jgi:integrase
MSSRLHEIVARSPRLADTTRRQYLQALDMWIAFAGTDPSGWTMQQAQAFYDGLLSRGIKPQTAKHYLSALQFADQWYSKEVGREPFVHVQRARNTRAAQRYPLTDEQARALLDSCADLNNPIDARDFAMITIGLETGMRRISLRSIMLSDLTTPKARPAYPHVNVILKGLGRDRYAIPMSDIAIAACGPWIAWLTAHRASLTGPLFRPFKRAIDKRTGHAMHVAKNSELSLQAIYKVIEARGTRAGFDMFPHLFRHTYITWRLAEKYPTHEVMSVTGHSLEAKFGAFGGYMSRDEICARMRNTTPTWLAEYVKGRL